MLLLDKYRPSKLTSLGFHKEINDTLFSMREGWLPNILIFGRSGAGKKTRISLLLKEIYGASATKVRVENRIVKSTTVPNAKGVDVTVISSSCHMEVNPCEVGFKDRVVIQELIKEFASTQLIAKARVSYKVVIIHEADGLTMEAQQALRRTMEKYTHTCRIILCATSPSRIIHPIRSRCFQIRVPLPSQDDIVKVLQDVGKKENFGVPLDVAAKIATTSDGNLRKALLILESLYSKHYPSSLHGDMEIEKPDWETYIHLIAAEIVKEQSPKCLLSVRTKLYELLSHCIPAELILRELTLLLLHKVDSELRTEIIRWAAFYENRLHLGSKDIFHLEAFIARFMSLYKKFLIDTFG